MRTSGRRMTWRLVAVMLLSCAFGTSLFAGDETAAQSSRSVNWNAYDVTIDVQTDGSFRVSERMDVAFSGAPAFRYGYADIPLGEVEAIADIAVFEQIGGELVPASQVTIDLSPPLAGTFFTRQDGSSLHIEYGFEPASDETRTFVIEYTAVRALRVYPDESPAAEQVYWRAIDKAVTEIAPIDRASVTVTFPSALPLDAVVLGEDSPGPAAEHTSDGLSWTWSKTGLTSGDDFIIRMQFPAVTGATAPTWQAAADATYAKRQRDERRRDQFGAVAFALALLALPSGGIYLLREYRNKGRDPQVGLVADIVTSPPDDLPGGLVGVLIDEKVGIKDIVATMIDLANAGELSIEQASKTEFTANRLTTQRSTMPHQQEMLKALFSGKRSAHVSLKDARKEISKRTSEIHSAMYGDLVELGYFDRSPESVRNKWIIAGIPMFAAGVAIPFFLSASRVFGLAAIALGIVLIVFGAAVFLLAQVMPRKTLKGAESAAKWRAFERYLKEIEKFEQESPLSRDPRMYERYLPYATAFGIDKQWTERFARAGAAAPGWFVPSGGGRWTSTSTGDSRGGGGGVNIPSAQGMSNSAMMSLASASAGMASFLDSAATAFTPPSSSGGGSGGGFSGGGGGGGGGGRGFG